MLRPTRAIREITVYVSMVFAVRILPPELRVAVRSALDLT